VYIPSRAKCLLFNIYAIKPKYKDEAGAGFREDGVNIMTGETKQDSRVMKSFPHGTEP
jgi:hypothetical protein